MDNLGPYISIFLLSIVKLVLGSVPLSIGFIKVYKISFVISMTLCCIGGYIGVIIFSNVGQKLWDWLGQFAWYRSYIERNPSTIKSRRRIVYIKNKYGLWGISFLSPIILSIPGGCILAARFYSNKSRIFYRMAISITIWVWGSGAILYLIGNTF